MLIAVLAVIALVLIIAGKVAPNPHVDLFWLGVLILGFLHLIAALGLAL